MKKITSLLLCIMLMTSLSGCGKDVRESAPSNTGYEEGYNAGYEEGYDKGMQSKDGSKKRYAKFSGSFTATVEQLLPDYCALPGKTIAVVHFFQERPFLLYFQDDMTDKLTVGTAYVFEFQQFEVMLADDIEYPSISNYMYSIYVTNYRIAKDNEIGLESKTATVEIILK